MNLPWRKLASKGEAIYQKIRKELLPSCKGKFAAIDAQSQEYFVGTTLLEALHKAKNRHPTHKFHFVRIGYPAAVSHKHRNRP